VTERTYTEREALALAVQAAEIALAGQPHPTHLTLAQAAEILKVSTRTVARMNLPRNSFGRIAYEDVMAARSSK
jgi:hypothetical protein